MGVDLARQLHVLLGAALLGIVICLFFELVRVTGHFLHGAFWRFVLDFVRVVVAVLGSFLYFQRSADGQIRWYDIGALVLSIWLFHICIGRFLVRPLCALLAFVTTFLKKLLMLTCYPLRILGRIFGKLATRFAKITSAFFKKVFIFCKKYIIIKPYPIFLKKNKVKEAPQNGNISRFYH